MARTLEDRAYSVPIENCPLLVEAFPRQEERTKLAGASEDRGFDQEQQINASGSGWGEEFDREIDPGSKLVLPPRGDTIALTARPSFQGRYTSKHIVVGEEGTGVVGWGSGVAHGAATLTEASPRIDLGPVFNLESAFPQSMILVPSLAEIITLLELDDERVADILKIVNKQLDLLLQNVNTELSQADSDYVGTAPNLSTKQANMMPTLVGAAVNREKLVEGQIINPNLAELHVLGEGATGEYLDGNGRVLARVSTKPGEWHIAYPSRTIRRDAQGSGKLVSTSKNGVHLTSLVGINDPAVISLMNLQQALSAAYAARNLWTIT
ncbi:MAG: hypothetical protein ACI9QC_000309 [Oceanicoccus sp.]|jgi:hypothetical protein